MSDPTKSSRASDPKDHRLRLDLSRATTHRRGSPAPTWDPDLIRTRSDGDPGAVFEREARISGMEVDRVSREELAERISSLVAGISPEKILVEPRLRESLLPQGTVPGKSEVDRDGLFAAEVGVVETAGGIAETGSLIFRSGSGIPRGFSLAPMTMIAIVKTSQIVPDLVDWLASLDPLDLPSNFVLVTGPSKTADIQMKLVTGVHGPGVVRVVVLDD